MTTVIGYALLTFFMTCVAIGAGTVLSWIDAWLARRMQIKVDVLPPPACKACRFCYRQPTSRSEDDLHLARCTRENRRDPVTGEQQHPWCTHERGYAGACGERGSRFVPRLSVGPVPKLNEDGSIPS